MKSIEKLEANYEKETELADRHRQNAADIKKEIELLKGNMINQKAKALNLNGAEYDRFMKLLSSDKNTLFEAIDLVLGNETAQDTLKDGISEVKGDDRNDRDAQSGTEENLE